MEWLELLTSLLAYFVYTLDEGTVTVNNSNVPAAAQLITPEEALVRGKWHLVDCSKSHRQSIAGQLMKKGDFVFLDLSGNEKFQIALVVSPRSEKYRNGSCRPVLRFARNWTVDQSSPPTGVYEAGDAKDSNGVLIYLSPEYSNENCRPLWMSYWCLRCKGEDCSTYTRTAPLSNFRDLTVDGRIHTLSRS